jgi:hypothetical protein
MADRTGLEGMETLLPPSARRTFLKQLGLTGAAVFLPSILIEACGSDNVTNPKSGNYTLDFSTDTGILNYAYALEQLESAFYAQVIATPYGSMPANEMSILGDVKQHEALHRDFFKAAIGTAAIGALSFNFSSIDFTSRTSVLTTAAALEDTGVAAYNGAGAHIVNPTYLLLAGKIVSVEARHASAIRDLLNHEAASNGFAGDDVVNPSTGLDQALPPSQVLPIASTYITTTITVKNGF